MGCHSSKGCEVVEQSQKPGDPPEGGEPKADPGTEAADGKDTSMKEGAQSGRADPLC
ncbi:Gm19935 [Phodopus roborovskii]|uniref:Gm19935 protein n=1 Tax=Phodopus roborovskii TaxID=109678 RepID=A0AAU9ZRV4_PHORO|nr:Gm19935 [Phodopus roborovskii]